MEANTVTRKEIAESSFEYLLGEIIHMNIPAKSNDSEAEAVKRLENIGFDVGYRSGFPTIKFTRSDCFDDRIIEKLCFTNGNRFIGTDPLDLIKFICKEFWEEIFKKKVSLISRSSPHYFAIVIRDF
jgi:hypothetical protein